MDLPLFKNDITTFELAYKIWNTLQVHAIGIRYGFVGDTTGFIPDTINPNILVSLPNKKAWTFNVNPRFVFRRNHCWRSPEYEHDLIVSTKMR